MATRDDETMVAKGDPWGSRKNKFAEFALRFGSDLADSIEQNLRNSVLFRGVCE